ncbi:hypothetical protein, partial [Streptomyces sp. NPDC006134]|uniref:hypothetical protein n=1 Tax=Streptomyces sp. NPDC006134 TaxID=3154467 RepID=UPI0033F480EF
KLRADRLILVDNPSTRSFTSSSTPPPHQPAGLSARLETAHWSLGMKHSDPQVLEALDLAWDPERGALGKLRQGEFDAELADRYVDLLSSIEITEGEPIHQDFVRLLWFAPLFAEWQIERAVKHGADQQKVSNFCDLVRESVMEILGTP